MVIIESLATSSFFYPIKIKTYYLKFASYEQVRNFVTSEAD